MEAQTGRSEPKINRSVGEGEPPIASRRIEDTEFDATPLSRDGFETAMKLVEVPPGTESRGEGLPETAPSPQGPPRLVLRSQASTRFSPLPAGAVSLRLRLRVGRNGSLAGDKAGLVRVRPLSGQAAFAGFVCGPVPWGESRVDWKLDLPPECEGLAIEFDEPVSEATLLRGEVRTPSRWAARGRTGWAAAKLLWKSPRGLWDDVARFVSRRTLGGRSPTRLPAPDRHPQCRPLAARVVAGRRPTLNVLLPSLQAQHLSGGPNTALNLAARLAERGIPVRFLSTDLPPADDPSILWNQLTRLTGGTAWRGNVEQAAAHDSGNPVDIGRDDRLLATAWWTLRQAADTLAQLRDPRPWYLIQDYEPGLYAWSSQYALARGTYDLDQLPVVCGHLLFDHLRTERVGRFADPDFAARALVFEPAIDRTLFHPEPKSLPTRRQLLFYARPDAPRNLYELGLIALRQAVDRGAFRPPDWELSFMGDNLAPVDLGHGAIIRQAPWAGYADYARMLRGCDVGLSLMLSPHTSYPPLEMAACGAAVVTNTFGVKTAQRLAGMSPGLIACEPDPESIARGLLTAAARSRRDSAGTVHVPATWEESFKDVLDGLSREWATRRDSGSIRLRSA